MSSLALLVRIFYSFAKVGIFGYGGGPSMMPLVQEEVVDVNHWMTDEEFVDALAMGNALPGPIASKISAYTGFKLAGLPGAAAGLIGILLPSLIAMLALTALFLQIKDSPRVQATLKAVRPAVVALLALVVYQIYPKSVVSWDTALIALVTFFALAILKIHPAIAIIAWAAFGFFFY